GGGFILAARWRLRRSRLVVPSRIASRLIAELGSVPDGEAFAGAAAAALVSFLDRVGGRAPGAITPDEARDDVIRLTDSSRLAVSAARLVRLCDRGLYADAAGARAPEIRELAYAVLRDLGRNAVAGKPREAPGTA
ncbi:MAG: hypothetical protein JWQ07_5286, partial [Ramlibacter sp.]|nr:hypothetical protein [Ramlibacter sp.]